MAEKYWEILPKYNWIGSNHPPHQTKNNKNQWNMEKKLYCKTHTHTHLSSLLQRIAAPQKSTATNRVETPGRLGSSTWKGCASAIVFSKCSSLIKSWPVTWGKVNGVSTGWRFGQWYTNDPGWNSPKTSCQLTFFWQPRKNCRKAKPLKIIRILRWKPNKRRSGKWCSFSNKALLRFQVNLPRKINIYTPEII